MITLGTTTCAGEQWVSPGIGERMIAYLTRTYGGVVPEHRPRRDGVNYNDLFPEPVAPRERGHLVTCAGCGALFRTSSRAQRCKPCADQRTATRIAEHNAEGKKRRAAEQT